MYFPTETREEIDQHDAERKLVLVKLQIYGSYKNSKVCQDCGPAFLTKNVKHRY